MAKAKKKAPRASECDEQTVLAKCDAKTKPVAKALGEAGFDWSWIAVFVLEYLPQILDIFRKRQAALERVKSAASAEDVKSACGELCELLCAAQCGQIEALGLTHMARHMAEDMEDGGEEEEDEDNPPA